MLTERMEQAITDALDAWDEVVQRNLIVIDREATMVAGNELARLLSFLYDELG